MRTRKEFILVSAMRWPDTDLCYAFAFKSNVFTFLLYILAGEGGVRSHIAVDCGKMEGLRDFVACSLGTIGAILAWSVILLS